MNGTELLTDRTIGRLLLTLYRFNPHGPRVVNRAVLESDVENPCKRWARERGWLVRKFKSPSNRSGMDDLFARHGRIVWVEFKRPKGEPTEKQADEHKAFRDAGCEVYVIDNVPAFKALFERIESEINWLD